MIWLLSLAFAAHEVPVAAMEAELERSMTELALPDEAPPWLLTYDFVDGAYTTSYAEFGALLRDDANPHRVVRIELRTGDENFDSANFESFGEPSGVVQVNVPQDNNELALRRELWLATDVAYKQAVEQLSRKQAELEPKEGEVALLAMEPVVDLTAEARDIDPERIRDSVTHLSGVLAEYPELESGVAAGRDWQGVRITVSSEGTRLAQTTGFAVVRVEAVLKHEDGSRLRNGRWWVAETAQELPSLEEMEAEVREMADWLVALEDAPVLDEYLGPVMFEEPAAVELFRQLAAPEMVGSPPPAEGRGLFGEASDKRPQARIGRRLLPEGWSIIDDPTADALGQYTYDYEGVPGEAITVVEDGVVRRLLQSRIPGTADSSTGHGRALGSDRREAIPSVVQVQPKRARSDRAMRRKALRLAEQTGHDSVLVVRRLEPPAMTEDFDIFFTGDGPPPGLTRPYEAYLLHKDGTTTPVRGLRFSGVDRRVMRDIVIAGEPGAYVGVLDDQPGPGRFHVGAVGGLPCSWSAPPVVIAELELVGSGGGQTREIPRP
jgi:TldD protein